MGSKCGFTLEGSEYNPVITFRYVSLSACDIFTYHIPHIISVNDVYGGTSRYIRRVAAENQGLEATFTFLDLEEAGDDEILPAFRENTKVTFCCLRHYIYTAHLDRIANEP